MNKQGLGQLRHLYKQMLNGDVKQEHTSYAAEGLLAPGIEELEKAHLEIERLTLIARDLYSCWSEAAGQLDEYFREKHGHNDTAKKYSGPEFQWLRDI
jgi:hypothetical protein